MNAMGFAVTLALAATLAGSFLGPIEPTAVAGAPPSILDARRDVERTQTRPDTGKTGRFALASFR